MRGQDKIVSDILTEFDTLPQLDDLRSSEGWIIPSSINVGDGQFIFITAKMKQLFTELADALIECHGLKSEFTAREWDNIVRRISGPILVEYINEAQDRNEDDAKSVAEKINRKVLFETEGVPECEYAFGCHLGRVDLDPFVIGPVRFESRIAWISRLRSSDIATDIDQRRLERAWQKKSLRPRKRPRGPFDERLAIDMTRDASFVCSVQVGPMGSEMGRQKALLAAQLATAAISLAWINSSRVLNDINLTYDRLPHNRCYFASTRGRSGGGSTASYLPGGVRSVPESWSEVRSDFGDMLGCAGEAIRFVTHGRNGVNRPNLMETLYQSLLWFHEGCREPIDPMAVANFCTSLEALAKGKRKEGIVQLMKTQLQLSDKGEEEVEENLRMLYGVGRSSTLHGNNRELGHDWTKYRAMSEFYARICLISCLRWVNEHPDSDDSSCLRGK